jgi:hypothetical protein
LKPLQRGAVLDHIIGKKFERYAATQAGIFRLIHHAHAAPAELFYHAIMGDCTANEGLCVRHGRVILICRLRQVKLTMTLSHQPCILPGIFGIEKIRHKYVCEEDDYEK